jgi:phosphatidylserine/phosphatidylglycerophosphate/cardiolipin synthase-like enzyme
MKKLFLLTALFLLLAACLPVDLPQPVAPLPVDASETPLPFIVPVTDTPIILPPVIDTPIILPPTSDAPFIVPGIDTPDVLPGPRWWDVYFTDPINIRDPNNPAGSIEEKLIGFINTTQTSIHIASFEFNLPRVTDALLAAKARGVDVRWVTDDENGLIENKSPNQEFIRLVVGGVEIKDDAGRSALMHNKFWIFDNNITWTGSTNITVNGIYKHNNNVIVIYSPDIAHIYEREWEELWSAQLGPRAPSTVNNQWAILERTPVQVLFSSEDHVVDNLIPLVNDAKVNIRFLAFSFTDYPLAEAMINRFKAGVDVQGVYEAFGSNSVGSEMKTFWCAGVPVRQDGNGSLMHHKVIVIDNSIVVTGSLNFSSSADEANEENILIIDNPEIAALYLQEYQKVWGLGTDVEAGTVTCE